MPVIKAVELATRGALSLRGIRSRYRATSHGMVHMYDGRGWGSLPHVVCLHGLASSAASFAACLRCLQSAFRRVTAIDLPGHGFSSVPSRRLDAARLVDITRDVLLAETEHPAVLVANSLGGALAVRFALDHPERVSAIALMSPAGAALSELELRALLGAFRFRSVRHAQQLFERLYHRELPLSALFAWDLKRSIEQPHLRELVAALEEAEAFSPADLRSLRPSVLMLWGKSDLLMPRSALGFFGRHLPPSALIEELDEVGHSPHVEAPHLAAERIIAFARACHETGEQRSVV